MFKGKEIIARDLAMPKQSRKASAKISFQGEFISVQPRIRLLRSFDQRSHSYLGYVILIRGSLGQEQRDFSVGIGKAVQSRHGFQVGDQISGQAAFVQDQRMEPVELYKASGLQVLKRPGIHVEVPPPWQGQPPDLERYKERGHRRLDKKTYHARCLSCIWGCLMPVEMIIDQWSPGKKSFRFESFCYGPKSCSLYSAGPVRTVPGRKGMKWREEDWVDEDATSHRGPDD